MINPGTLHLFPVPIIEGNIDSIPFQVINEIKKIDFFIVERAKSARRFLKSISHPLSFDEIELFELDKKDSLKDNDEWLNRLLSGQEIGLLSEAGTPCIADPGEQIVAFAHQVKAKVKPYVGPSSILLALIGSGLNGEEFHFHTYLPIQGAELSKKLKVITNDILKNGTSHIFIETPYRNVKTFEMIKKSVPSNLDLCLAINLTSKSESITTRSIADWKRTKIPNIQKVPAVFIIGKMQ